MSRFSALLPLGGALLWTTTAAAQTAQPKDKEPTRPPQVRTYSTVTVVEDPAKAPRLPTQKTASPAPKDTGPPTHKDALPPKDAPQAKDTAAAAKDTASQLRAEAKHEPNGKSPVEPANREALRQELRSTARALRETAKRETGEEKATAAQPTRKQTATDRTPAAESRREQRLRVFRERTGQDN